MDRRAPILKVAATGYLHGAVCLAGIRLLGAIDCSWLWVLCTLWIPAAVLAVCYGGIVATLVRLDATKIDA